MTRRMRILLGAVFVIAFMLIGLVLGTMIGGRYFVAPGSGLAGPAIALGYGVLGAAGLGIAALGLAIYLPPRWLLATALPAIVAGMAIAVLIGRAMTKSNAERDAHLEQAYANLNRFTVVLAHPAPGAGRAFARMEAQWDRGGVYTALLGEGDGRRCSAALSGREAVALLGALRGAEGVLYRDPAPCADAPGAAGGEIEWTIREVKAPDSLGKIAITAACASKYPQLLEPFKAAAEILEDGDNPTTCN